MALRAVRLSALPWFIEGASVQVLPQTLSLNLKIDDFYHFTFHMPPLYDSRPERRARGTSHDPPHWVEDDALFFITINCQQRGPAQLTTSDIPTKIFESVSHYHLKQIWRPEIFLLMPDHLHALIVFSWTDGYGLRNVLKNWKRFTARMLGINWQRDFFDHRIRSQEDHDEKWTYIRDNPVRDHLVNHYGSWPHVWFPDGIGWP